MFLLWLAGAAAVQYVAFVSDWEIGADGALNQTVLDETDPVVKHVVPMSSTIDNSTGSGPPSLRLGSKAFTVSMRAPHTAVGVSLFFKPTGFDFDSHDFVQLSGSSTGTISISFRFKSTPTAIEWAAGGPALGSASINGSFNHVVIAMDATGGVAFFSVNGNVTLNGAGATWAGGPGPLWRPWSPQRCLPPCLRLCPPPQHQRRQERCHQRRQRRRASCPRQRA